INYDSVLGYTFTNITQNHNVLAIFANNITIPNSPTNIIAVGGNGQATVAFTSPLNNGGSPINKYTISATTGNITASGLVSPIVVTGLTNGTSYRFVVNAINSIGSSLSSDTSNAIITSASGKFINTMVLGGQITPTNFINAGGNLTITYKNNTGYILDSIYINGMYSARATADSISQYTFKNVGADSAIKVVYKISRFTITALAGTGGSISPQGSSRVIFGYRPSYTITPNIGYVIDSITINGNKISNVYNITLDSVKENQTIEVVFKLQTIAITTSAGYGGSISPQGVSFVNYGATPSYTITPSSGYEIDSIIVNGFKISNVNYLTLDSVKGIQHIRVVFRTQTFTIFALARSGGIISPQGNTTVKLGDRQVYTISPNNGYIIDSITVNGVKITNSNIVTLDTIKSNLSIIVTFKIKTFTITSKAGLNGKINAEGVVTINIGGSRIYSIIPDEGYEVDSLIVDDIVLFNTNIYIFNDVQSNRIISATFKIKTFTIIASAGNGGSISPQDTMLANYGSKLIYTISPNDGYVIDSLIIDGYKIDISNTYTFENIIAKHTIRVTFKLKQIIKTCPNIKVSPTIVRVGNALQSDITNFSKHKWYLNGTFKDSTITNNYTPSTSGVYTLLGLDTNDCESNFSKKYYYSSACIIPTGRLSNAVFIQSTIADFPNQIIIKWCPDVIENNLNIKVIDFEGAVIMNVFIPANNSTFVLDKQKINSKNYFIQVSDSKGEILETSDYINIK
ncbi:MAG: fibronectin type III domain-containing protein, partial [Sediminibacterium sp.]|nr:fibronectin type III domain-containing protein [Sediminibacterium sp.]